MITRTQIFNWFKSANPELTTSQLTMLFKPISDEELANSYNLKVLRKGCFY